MNTNESSVFFCMTYEKNNDSNNRRTCDHKVHTLSLYMTMYDKRAITLLHIFMGNQKSEIEKSTNSNRMMSYHKLL